MAVQTSATDTVGQGKVRRGRWIDHWDPEDEIFWADRGQRIARRNLIASIFAEHIGFSVWSMWSVLVLFMSPAIGFHIDASEKFLLVSVPTLVGAMLRLPYSYAVTRFGGRNWTIFSASILLVPTVLALVFVHRPDTPSWVFVLLAALTGVGGGNFASSMTNINNFYPERKKGRALGLNAGGGNIGVATIQLVGLFVIAAFGSTSPAYVAAIYLPLIVLASLTSALFMDNLTHARADLQAQREAVSNPHTWLISALYIGTFGSFIGYSFAFGLVLQSEFGFSPLRAASLTFIGPLLGSLARPFGGWMSDRSSGSRVTFWSLLAMGAGTAGLIVASAQHSFGLFLFAFVALFVFTGLGNGSTYKMIPAVFQRQAELAIAHGANMSGALARARRMSGAVIGIAGAIGALGGVFINLGFRTAYGSYHSGQMAFVAFLAYYAVCVVLTWVVYLRKSAESVTEAAARPAPDKVRG